MTLTDRDVLGLLRELERQGIRLSAQGDTLRFDAPRGRMTPELRSELGHYRVELLRVLADESASSTRQSLSLAQRRFWLLDRIDPGSPAYTISAALQLRGDLDEGALRRALDRLIHRHAALRSICELRDGEPVAVVREPAAIALRVVDLAALAPHDCQRAVQDCQREEARRAFDLSTSPLLRATLLRLSHDHHRLILSTHHFAADGWSVGVLLNDLGSLYSTELAGAPRCLAPLRTHYAAIAAEQERALARGAWAEELRWWKEQLAGAPPLLSVAADRVRPSIQSHQGGIETALLPPPLVADIKAFCRRAGVTPFMALLAGFKVLLARYSATDDVIVGTAVSERLHANVEGVVGPLSNNLVLRTRLDGDPTFAELVARVRVVAARAYARQHVPFERLIEELRPVRDPGHSPLFQVMFVMHDATVSAPALQGLETSWETLDNGGAKFDLHLAMLDSPEGIRASLEYATDLFDRSTIVRMLSQLRVLLSAAVADPQLRISTLPLLDRAERKRILVGFNNTSVAYPSASTLHALVEAQVDRTPDAIAVVDETTRLSYRQLEENANRLAHVLQARGVGADVPVGACLERSVDMVVALLAILKAGGCYLPLEPSYPSARLAMMLADAHPRLVVTTGALRERLPEGVEQLLLDGDDRPWVSASAGRCETRSGSEHLAYIIFTSGSTGRPKGVMIPHHGITNRLLWMQDAYRLAADDVVLQKTPFGFDVSVWEFFWPLISGARLVMARPEGHRDPDYLIDVIAREAVTTVHFVPSMLQLFLEYPVAGGCRSLRRVVCSGEALPASLARRFHATLDCELHNLYGPTEASIDVTAWRCAPDDERASVPIGRPIANTQIYILDAAGQPVPIGVPGELHIGGVGLARGYVNRPDLTAERFIPNPFSALPDARLYRTGDLARFLADGTIEYCGRLDDQVKVRGVRIELAEVEAALRSHPDVRDAVALATEIGGSPQLAACLVPAAARPPVPAELRAFLLQRLPEPMVPTRYALISEIPLTPNGKADRRALAPRVLASEPEAARDGDAVVGLESPQEVAVAWAWADVLGLDPGALAAEDDFFGLGGDSFKAIRLTRLLTGLAVADIFRYPTLRALANHLRQLAGGDRPAAGVLVPIGPASAEAPRLTLLCIPYGGGDVAAYQPLAATLPTSLAVRAVVLPGRAGAPPHAPDTLDRLAAACVEEVLATVSGPLAVYGHCVGAVLAVEIALRLEQAGRQLEGVFVGGSIPPGQIDAEARAPAMASDSEILENLRRLGGFEEQVDPESLQTLMAAFRSDVRIALDYFAAVARTPPVRRIEAPLYCIVGEHDPFTSSEEHQFGRWQGLARTVHLVRIPDGGHYFVKHQARSLGALLVQVLRQGVGADVA